MSAMLFKRSEQAFCFKPGSVAIAFDNAPFVMVFVPAFIDFIGGNMMAREGNEHAKVRGIV